MRRSSSSSSSSCWVVLGAVVSSALAIAPAAGVHAAAGTRAAIDAQDALERVKILAAPDMEGRGATTAGLGRAADYIAGRFADMKLGGGGDAGPAGRAGFFQTVDIPLGRRPAPETALALDGRPLALGRDFAPSGAAAGARAVGGLVFAGYGIVVPGRYDDYAGIDARGKLIVCLRYAPRYDRKSGQAADDAFTAGASLMAKVEAAVAHGAVGLAIVDPPAGAGDVEPAEVAPLAALSPAHEGLASLLAAAPSPGPAAVAKAADSEAASDAAIKRFASFHVARAAVDALLARSGRSVASLQQAIDGSGRPASFALPGYADFRIAWQQPKARSCNVIALLEGSDPALRDQAVLIGAHFDHLGHGDEGSAFFESGTLGGFPGPPAADSARQAELRPRDLSGTLGGFPGPPAADSARQAELRPRVAPGLLFPGADDNASGTAAVLEVAEAFAAPGARRPRRSVLFVAFTGEERGLIGSMALAARAGGRTAGKRIVAMINLDMVGRMKGNAVEVGGGGTAPEWEAIVREANREDLALTFPKRVVPNSDHAAFLHQRIPSLFLFTGLHGDYHRASDTWDKINADGLARTARLAYRIVDAVANRVEALAFVAPQWTRAASFGGVGAHGGGVRLGVMPDYQFEGGFRIGEVMSGGAAATAGLKAGDVIEAIGGKPIGDIEGYMEMLAELHPGDETTVRVRREGGRQELKVRFAAAADVSVGASSGAAGASSPGAAPGAREGAHP